MARSNDKREILKAQKVLNPHPDRVEDEVFKDNEFFDPDDMVQLKYEMLRRVRIEGWDVVQAAKAFGFSRPSYYKIQKAFQDNGLVGLLPQKAGPKGAHKLSEEVMGFIEQIKSSDDSIRAPKLAILIEEEFGRKIHPRTVERALSRLKKRSPV